MTRRRGWRAVGTVVLALALLLAAGCGGDDEESSSGGGGASATTSGGQASGEPIVIGAAIDQTDFMKFFNLPALTAARIEAEKINANGGVNGRPIVFKVQDTTLDPAKTKSAAADLLGKGAEIGWVTCDVDYATPAVTEFLNRGKLAIAPCIGTDQMGPKRFSSKGDLAFSFGNVAQDEGAALAKMAYDKGWKTATVVTDKLLVYTQNVCTAFTKAYSDLGGKVVAQESFKQGDKTIANVVSRVNAKKSDVIAICTVTQADLPTFMSGIRSLGNKTPIVSPWSADGTFWTTPQVKNFYVITFASVFGDDPNQAVKSLISKMKQKGQAPTTGGFITGAEAVDAIAEAVKKAGSTDGAKLADVIEGLSGFETDYGKVSFSSDFHTVFGREYRIIKIDGKKAKVIGTVSADSPADIG